jgi:hypothetical protein
LKGFTYAGGLKRHEKQIHKMSGSAEFYCPHAGCSRAEGEGKPFTRNENLADHLRRRHNEQDTISRRASRPIAAGTGAKGKQKLAITDEAEAQGETALLRTMVEQLARRVEELEEERFRRQFPE